MRWLLLLLFAAFNAFADLPTMEDPSRGQGQGIMETLQNYGFDIVVLLALAICAVGFLVVANNCIATYSEIKIWARWRASAVFFWWSSSGCSTRLRTSCNMTTIPFLPDRLNREPVVWRGLTTSELFLVLALGLGVGCAFGIVLALITHYWPLIPRFSAGRCGVVHSGWRASSGARQTR